MFEVGKRYRCHGTTGDAFVILFANDQVAFGYWEGTKKVYDYRFPCEFPNYREVPPEPKRWSTWQNVYSDDRRTHPAAWESRPIASGYINNSYGKHLGYLRRDFEQYGEKEVVCVNVELEKVW